MPSTSTSPGAFIWRILIPFIVILTTSVALSAWTLVEIAKQQDAAAERQSIASLASTWRTRDEDLKRLIKDYAAWGDAYRNLHIKIDKTWAYDADNFSHSLLENFGVKYVAVVNPEKKSVYFVRNGALVDDAAFAMIQAKLADLIDDARAVESNDSRAVTKSIVVDGEPVTFVAAALATGADSTVAVTAGDPSIALFGDALDPASFDQLGRKAFVPGLRAASSPTDAAASPSMTIGAGGEPALTLRWSPDRPGAALLRELAPWLALAGALLLAFILLIVRFAWKTKRTIEAGSEELERSYREAHHRSLHDIATGLPNRAMLTQRLTGALSQPQQCLSVVYVDLDNFKLINDTLGHPVGDLVLETTAARLEGAVEPGDLVARIGGDEFVIVAVRRAPADVEDLCRRLLAEVPKPISHMEHTLHVGLSIGVAIAPRDASTAAELIRLADIALYQAKANGRRSFRFFAPEMNERMLARAGMEHELARAIGSGEFVLLFEEIRDARTLQAMGVEAKLQWRHPVKGVIDAGEFMPIAAETGLLAPILSWTLRTSCAAAAKWKDLDLTVRVSIGQLKPGQLLSIVGNALARSKMEPSRLELCVDEGALTADAAAALATLHVMRSLGVKLSIEGVGGGCPSMTALKAFAFDSIRIGGAFVSDLRPNGPERTILRALVGLAQSLDASLVAENVESPDVLLLLQLDQCARVQGSLISAPKTSAELDLLSATSDPAAMIA